MRKPLELVVHPPLHPVEREYIEDSRRRGTRPVFVDAARIGMLHAKRLTDPELAAEYHAWVAHMNRMQWAELARGEDPEPEAVWAALGERAATLYRFALANHYDQADNPEEQ